LSYDFFASVRLSHFLFFPLFLLSLFYPKPLGPPVNTGFGEIMCCLVNGPSSLSFLLFLFFSLRTRLSNVRPVTYFFIFFFFFFLLFSPRCVPGDDETKLPLPFPPFFYFARQMVFSFLFSFFPPLPSFPPFFFPKKKKGENGI